MGLTIPTATLVDDFKFISAEDPAVDSSGDDFPEVWKRFLETGQGAPIKEGQEPVIWTLRHISKADVRAAVEDMIGNKGVGSATAFLCRYSLRSVAGLTDEHGQSVKVPKVRENGFELVASEFMDDLERIRKAGGPNLITEIGSWAMQSMTPS